MTEERSTGELLDETQRWRTTSIIGIHPGEITVRSHSIKQLIGNVTSPQTIWLTLMGELLTEPQATLLEAAFVAGVGYSPQAPSIAILHMAAIYGPSLSEAMTLAIDVLDDIHGDPGEQCMEVYYGINALAGAGGDLESATIEVVARHKASELGYLPGSGHRFYSLDPRTPRLLDMVREAAATGDVSDRFATIGIALEDTSSKGRVRQTPMNVSGAMVVIHCELGLVPELGCGVFVLSRSIEILTYVWEQM